MKVLPLIGYKALRAFNAFHTLVLGVKMLPAYMELDYETFLEMFEKKTEEEKAKLLENAVRFVPLSQDEVEALAGFCADPNGIPYEPANLKNLTPIQLSEILVSVCMEIGRIQINLVTEDEKKIRQFTVDLRGTYVRFPNLPLDELINHAFLEAVRHVS